MVVEMGFCEGGPLVELGPLTKNALYLSVIIFKNIKRQTDPYCKVDKEVNKRKKKCIETNLSGTTQRFVAVDVLIFSMMYLVRKCLLRTCCLLGE